MIASCCVAGITNPSIPVRSLNPCSPEGMSSGATLLHNSGRNPETRLTPPIVVRGSRNEAMAAARSRSRWASDRSHSRYTWEDVPRLKMPLWPVFIDVLALGTEMSEIDWMCGVAAHFQRPVFFVDAEPLCAATRSLLSLLLSYCGSSSLAWCV